MGNERRAWAGIVSHPFDSRTNKPRTRGLTMVIDKGLGLHATGDLCELAGHCIDFLKFSFGTSAFYARDLLKRKIQLVRQHGIHVYPGGTLFELAVLQDQVDAFIEECLALGFSSIEISDGTVSVAAHVRRHAVTRASAAGLRVLTEVGKKHPADRVPQLQLHRQIRSDLEAGAFKVIVEGRESGKGVVIYDDDGRLRDDELASMVAAVPDLDAIIWEAPRKSQQQDLILRFGTNVNLGNVPTDDVLSVEALRVGLRGDTLRAALLAEGHEPRGS